MAPQTRPSLPASAPGIASGASSLSVAESRRALAASISETEWQRTVEEALTATGHLVAHFRPARTNKGWRTAMSGHPGYPDITAIGQDGRLKVAELKTLKGRVTREQQEWLDRFQRAGAHIAVLRAGDAAALDAFVRVGRP